MFNEASVVERLVLERMANRGWEFAFGPTLSRATTDVLLERELVSALIHLNPDIQLDPSRADEVIYKLRAVIQGVIGDGLVAANEKFMSWLRGEQTMPFGSNGEPSLRRYTSGMSNVPC